MKTHVSSDPGLRLSPRGKRLLWLIIIVSLLIAFAFALTDRTEAAGGKPDACWKWQSTCTSYRYIFGVRICTAWRTTCIGAPTAQRVAGLASYTPGNKGGCGRDNLLAVSCNVTDAGVGFVSGTCEMGYWFDGVPTGRTFITGEIVTARGCIGLRRELYAPIRITR